MSEELTDFAKKIIEEHYKQEAYANRHKEESKISPETEVRAHKDTSILRSRIEYALDYIGLPKEDPPRNLRDFESSTVSAAAILPDEIKQNGSK